MEFSSFFDADMHYRNMKRQVVECIMSPPVHISPGNRMPEIVNIFTCDIENELPKLFRKVSCKRQRKEIKSSNVSFRECIKNGFPVLLGNYKRVMSEIAGGSLLRDGQTSKHDFDAFVLRAQDLYEEISNQLFFDSRKERRASLRDSTILICTIVGVLLAYISVYR